MYRMAWSHELTKAQKAILLIYCPWGCENILADHRNGYLLPKRCCNTNWLYQCSDVLCSGRGETTCRSRGWEKGGGERGIWITLALPKSVQHYTKRWSYWVVILILLKIKYFDKSCIIIMWHVLPKPMALQTGRILMSMHTPVELISLLHQTYLCEKTIINC